MTASTECTATYAGDRTKGTVVRCDRVGPHHFHRHRQSGAGWQSQHAAQWTTEARQARKVGAR